MSEFSKFTDDSRKRWEENAKHWDCYMGEESNAFHREIIRPETEKLLQIKAGQRVLDIACGNGNFSKVLAEKGAFVVALDYSSQMIAHAKERCAKYLDKIDFQVIDATDYGALIALGEGSFDSAVANMAIMDMAEIRPLFRALNSLLKPRGTFVFSITHPCFQPPGLVKVYETSERGNEIFGKSSIKISHYLQPETFEGVGINGQPVASRYFHRPLHKLCQVFFSSGFVIDGLSEPAFSKDAYKDKKSFEWLDIPPAIIFRLRKEGT